MKPRIPIAYAGLLVTALMAAIGLAAFSPGAVPTEGGAQTTTVAVASPDVSARVASAVLAVRVSDAGTRVAAPASPQDTETVEAPVQAETLSVAETTDTVLEVSTTTASTTTAPTTTEQQAASTTASTAPTTTKPKDTTPPSIKITSPDDEDVVTDRLVTFSGTSEPGAKVVSGPYAATMSDDGSWTIKLAVSDGANGAKFTATDAAGNASTTAIVVYYNEPASTTTTKPATTTTKPAATTTTKPSATTTTKPSATTTTSGSPSSKWSPNWPADSGGARSIESWRATVEKYWPANRVDCALGIIKRESNGDPRAFNASTSAEGLMQHLSKYWTSRAKGAGFVDGNGLVASPYNGAANIAAGAFLANYYDGAIGQWWNPWKSGGKFTATYGSCQSSNPG